MYEELDKQIAKIKQQIKQTQEEKEKIEIPPMNSIQDSFVWIQNKKIVFEKRKILEDKIEMYLPKTFFLMPEEQARIKYPSQYRPAYIFTNLDTTINLTFTYDSAKAQEEDIPRARDLIFVSTQKLNPSIQIVEKAEEKVGEKCIFYFSFFSPALDALLYNLMFFVEIKGHLLMGNFNCKKSDYYDWEPIAKQMLASIQETNKKIQASL